MKTNWIKKGLKREWREMKEIKNLYFMGALIGIPSAISIFLPVNLKVLGILYITLGILGFIFQNKPKKEDQNE
jgi:hypothetical protein